MQGNSSRPLPKSDGNLNTSHFNFDKGTRLIPVHENLLLFGLRATLFRYSATLAIKLLFKSREQLLHPLSNLRPLLPAHLDI